MLDETAEYMQVTVNKGEKVERPADPEKEGYEFSYWSQSIAGRAFNFDTLIKYSLQGTTQGNGLTGGLPPVRFSM